MSVAASSHVAVILTNMVSSSHSPVLPAVVPYWVILIKIVPTLINHAGTNRLSVGCSTDAMNVEG